jgi:glycine cleavage system H protein
MFPWVDGFHWSPGHIVFLSLFFAALLVIFSTVVSAVWRTAADFRAHRATELCWHETFAALPEAERHCRHQFAGRVPWRICDNGFDCRSCKRYPDFAALPAKPSSQNAGVSYSDELLYHRGHTWVEPQADGTFTVGLDDFARHLIGKPDSVELPPAGTEIERDGIAWRMKKNDHAIRVRAPIDGTVLCTGKGGKAWYLKIRPRQPVYLCHLLGGAEVPGWLTSELDRARLQLAEPSAKPCLNDGGVLLPDWMDAVPEADWETVLAATFLDG